MKQYTYNEKEKLLELDASGEMKIIDIIEHYEYLITESSFPSNLKVLIDCRNVNFKIDPDEMPLCLIAVNNSLKKFNRLTEAIIVDKPYETVIATMFSQLTRNPSYNFQVYSSKLAARNWLALK